jgi:hypothetical protein
MRSARVERYLSRLSSDKPDVKYPAAKKLIEISETDPESLYPHMQVFLDLLSSKNSILKWTAIDVVSHLCCIDKDNHVDRLLKTFVDFLRGGKLITANHAVAALSHIASKMPEYRSFVTNELLKCEKYKYETGECHNIVMGKVIQALGSYLNPADTDARIFEFIKRQTSNTRAATGKKAETFLRKAGRKGGDLQRIPNPEN